MKDRQIMADSWEITLFTQKALFKANHETFWEVLVWLARPEEPVKSDGLSSKIQSKYTVVNVKAWLYASQRLDNALKPSTNVIVSKLLCYLEEGFASFLEADIPAAEFGNLSWLPPSLELQSEEISGFWEHPHEDPRAGRHTVVPPRLCSTSPPLTCIVIILWFSQCQQSRESLTPAVTEEQQPIVLL